MEQSSAQSCAKLSVIVSIKSNRDDVFFGNTGRIHYREFIEEGYEEMTSATAEPHRRLRQNSGRYYEDFIVGDIYEHRPGRTITETDNIWFTLLTMNTHPLHFDNAYAGKSEFGKPLVNSCLTLSMVVGMSVGDVSQKAIGNLGWNDIKLTSPVFVGDTIYAESEVLSKRESKTRPTQGIVMVRTTGIKADGTIFMSFERNVLVPKQGHGIEI